MKKKSFIPQLLCPLWSNGLKTIKKVLDKQIKIEYKYFINSFIRLLLESGDVISSFITSPTTKIFNRGIGL